MSSEGGIKMNKENLVTSDEEFLNLLIEITMKSGGKTKENYNMALTVIACCDTKDNEKIIRSLIKEDGFSLRRLYEKSLALPHEYM